MESKVLLGSGEIPVPLIYVAGPYGDKGGYLAIERNIGLAREGAAWITRNGMFFLCPHLNSAHFEAITPETTVEHWYGQDMRLMGAADAILLVGKWKTSRGVTKELKKAKEAGIRAFNFNSPKDLEQLLKWRDKWIEERVSIGHKL